MKVFAEKKSDIFRILSQAISEGIVIVNHNQEIVASNDAANRMFGYGQNELIRENLNILIPINYHRSHPKKVDEFMGKSDPRQMGHGHDLHGRRKDQTVFPVEAGLNPFVINENRYVMALVTDISVRKSQ